MKKKALNWKFLQRRIASVKVESCANGTFRVLPVWHKKYAFGETKSPGIFTRMACAGDLAEILNARLKGRGNNADPS